jgi:hypothetical protein
MVYTTLDKLLCMYTGWTTCLNHMRHTVDQTIQISRQLVLHEAAYTLQMMQSLE